MNQRHVTDITVRWVDIDQYQHVNNGRYFDYMTEARASFLASIMAFEPQTQFVLVDTHCNFQKPVHYPASLRIEQYVTEMGRASFNLAYDFFNIAEPGELIARGTAKMVCVNANTLAATAPSQALRDLLKQHQPTD
jgi:acyl-CoA thioester hydrolase